MPSNELDATVQDGLQQIIADRHQAVLEQQIAKREVHAFKQQLASSKERCIELEKKVCASNSFNKRYNVYKEEAEKVLDPEQCSEIRSKARSDALDQQKVFVKRFEQEKVEHEAALEAHQAKFAEERVALKKKSAARSPPVTAEGAGASSSSGKKKKPKDPNAPKRSCVPSAYSRYVGDKKVKEAYKKGQADGTMIFKNLFTYAASVWANMTEDDKKPYNDAQKADKAAKDLASAADGSKKSAGGKRKKASSDDDDDSPAEGEGDGDDEEPAPKAAKPDKPSSSKSAKPEATNGKASKQTKLKVVPAAVPAKKPDSDDDDQDADDEEVKEASDDDDDDDQVPAAEDDDSD